MKENKYDDENFFQQYSHFPRSVKGLNAAGEWSELRAMLPDFRGKRVLDIGCGFGWHCIYAAEHGAEYVLGTDISEKMMGVARDKTVFTQVEYRCIPMEDLDFPPGYFDVVISSLAFHYTPDFPAICEKVSRFLTPGGWFVFSVEHPVFTAYGPQQWILDNEGNPQYWPVDNYFSQGKRDAIFLGEHIVKYHNTLTTYVNTLLELGFIIRKLNEPCPPVNQISQTISTDLRRPMMLLISSEKPK